MMKGQPPPSKGREGGKGRDGEGREEVFGIVHFFLLVHILQNSVEGSLDSCLTTE